MGFELSESDLNSRRESVEYVAGIDALIRKSAEDLRQEAVSSVREQFASYWPELQAAIIERWKNGYDDKTVFVGNGYDKSKPYVKQYRGYTIELNRTCFGLPFDLNHTVIFDLPFSAQNLITGEVIPLANSPRVNAKDLPSICRLYVEILNQFIKEDLGFADNEMRAEYVVQPTSDGYESRFVALLLFPDLFNE